jgi:endonuclease YncB( thermonuclease family)
MRASFSFCAIAFLFSVFTGSAQAQSDLIAGKIIHIEDGDSITMLTSDNQHLKIRIHGIDAPEICHSKNDSSCKKRPGQPFGRAAKESLTKKIQGKTVSARCPTKDRYGRNLCRIYDGKQDVGLPLLSEGLAWHYTKYDATPAYAEAQQKAQNKQWGIWGAPQPIKPSHWRKKCWERQDCPQ